MDSIPWVCCVSGNVSIWNPKYTEILSKLLNSESAGAFAGRTKIVLCIYETWKSPINLVPVSTMKMDQNYCNITAQHTALMEWTVWDSSKMRDGHKWFKWLHFGASSWSLALASFPILVSPIAPLVGEAPAWVKIETSMSKYCVIMKILRILPWSGDNSAANLFPDICIIWWNSRSPLY